MDARCESHVTVARPPGQGYDLYASRAEGALSRVPPKSGAGDSESTDRS